MLEISLNGGLFMTVLAVIFSIILFLLIKSIYEPFKTNFIVLLGIYSALFGILGTHVGVKNALNVITAINISPEILINSFTTSLITAYAGAIIIFFFQHLLGTISLKNITYLVLKRYFNSSYLSLVYGKVNCYKGIFLTTLKV